MTQAQEINTSELKNNILKNHDETKQNFWQQKLASYYITANKIKDLEIFTEEIKALNQQAYSNFCWNLMQHYNHKNLTKYDHYAKILKELHPNDQRLKDALAFNDLQRDFLKKGPFIDKNDFSKEEKLTLETLSKSNTFYGSLACELYYKHFDSKPCSENEKSIALKKQSTASFNQSIKDTQEIKLFPNPSKNGSFTIELKGFDIQNHIEIYSSLGAKVWEKSSVNHETKVELSHLQKGVYFVRVSDDSTSKIKQILIQ